MATGSGFIDANGVWIFGEADDEGLASDTLNLGQDQASLLAAATDLRLDSLEASRANPATFVAVDAAARDSHWGTPATASTRRALQDKGAATIRLDTGTTERYLAGLTDGGANPGGASVAGWYPISGDGTYGIAQRSATVTSLGVTTYALLTTLWAEAERSADMTALGATGKWFAPKAGWYEVKVRGAGNGTAAVLAMTVKKNSVTLDAAGEVLGAVAGSIGNLVHLSASGLVKMAVGDYLAVVGFASVAFTFLTTAESCEFSLRFVKPAKA